MERTLTGTCTDAKKLIQLGPELAYGSPPLLLSSSPHSLISSPTLILSASHPPLPRTRGNQAGTVPPNSTVSVEVEVVRVRNKKPDSDIGLGFLKDLANGRAKLPGGR